MSSTAAAKKDDTPVELVRGYFHSSSDEETFGLGQKIEQRISSFTPEERELVTQEVELHGDFHVFWGEILHLNALETEAKKLEVEAAKLAAEKDGLVSAKKRLISANHGSKPKLTKEHSLHLRKAENLDHHFEDLAREIEANEAAAQNLRDRIRDSYNEVILPLAKTAERRKELLEIIRSSKDDALREALLRDDLVANYLIKKKKGIEAEVKKTKSVEMKSETAMAEIGLPVIESSLDTSRSEPRTAPMSDAAELVQTEQTAAPMEDLSTGVGMSETAMPIAPVAGAPVSNVAEVTANSTASDLSTPKDTNPDNIYDKMLHGGDTTGTYAGWEKMLITQRGIESEDDQAMAA